MIPRLNLPIPSPTLQSYINYYIGKNSTKNANYSKQWFSSTQKDKINCAAGYFLPDNILVALGKKEYKNYFSESYNMSVGILQNLSNDEKYAFIPPHVDKGRTLSLMYIVNQGGENTMTTFYKSPHKLYTPKETIMVEYGKLERIFSIQTLEGNWYLLDVQQYHSVENIEHKRILFSINFYELTFKEFYKKYKHLILE